MGNTPSSRPSSSSRYQFDPTLDAKGPEDTVNAGKSDTKAGPDNTRGVPLDPPPPYYTEAGETRNNKQRNHRGAHCYR